MKLESALCVPTIDISSLVAADRSKVNKTDFENTIKQIGKACEEWGFFYIVNHGIDQEFIKKTSKLAMNFFLQSKELKDTVRRNENNFQGYSDSELTKQKVDWKQLFDWTETLQDSDVPKLGVHGRNQWPKNIPEFEQTMVEYFKKMQVLSKTLMEGVLKTLTTEENLVEKFFEGGEDTSMARLNYYPICPNPETNLGVGPHSDPGILTVLLQDDSISSLQVLKDDKWYDVPPVPNSYVINIGDMMQVWSNNKYKGPVHRVLANHTQGRLSIPYFLCPAYSCIVEPLKETVTPDHPEEYKPIHWGHFRKARYEGDYADRGEEIQIAHFKLNN